MSGANSLRNPYLNNPKKLSRKREGRRRRKTNQERQPALLTVALLETFNRENQT